MRPFYIAFQVIFLGVPVLAALWSYEDHKSQLPLKSPLVNQKNTESPSISVYEGVLWRFETENQDIFEWTLRVAEVSITPNSLGD